MNKAFRNIRYMILAVGLLSAAAVPAAAQDLSTRVDGAVAAYTEAVDDENAGNYSDACREYRGAADRFEGAIYSLLGSSMQTEEDRENTKAYANHLQENVDAAKAGASRVCNK